MEKELILRLHINILKVDEVASEKANVRMIHFDGDCTGKYFTGKILEGGIDTQIFTGENRGTLSARYMIEGNNEAGEKCHLFIQNNGVSGEEWTKPEIYTDNDQLKWMEECELLGKLVFEKEELYIEIYRKEVYYGE